MRTKRWGDLVRVLLVPNVNSERAVAAVTELVTWLTAAGYEPVMSQPDAEACGMPAVGVPGAEIGTPGLVVALGGDGTILKAVHLLGTSDAPVLGVNLGRLGFMAGAHADDLHDAVRSALAGEGLVSKRAMLDVEVTVGGREAGRYRALNEAFVGRGGSSRSIEIALTVNGTALDRFTCDGVVVATPTGSTAYALSAGGPVLAPDVNGMVVLPVAPHTLAARPLVAGPADVVELSLPNPARADACLTIDGDAVPCRQQLERIVVRRSADDVSLIKLGGRGFYEVYRDEFLGG